MNLWEQLSSVQQKMLARGVEEEDVRVRGNDKRTAFALMRRKYLVEFSTGLDGTVLVHPTKEGLAVYGQRGAHCPHRCRICGFKANGTKGLHRHVKHRHGMSAAAYYLLHLDALRVFLRSRIAEVEHYPEIGSCWEWQGLRCPKGGYGRVRVAGLDTDRAHIISWLSVHGRKPHPGMVLLHACDNPRCINPEHLSEGTVAENNYDRYVKGRSSRGVDHHNVKLSEDDVHLIRRLRSQGFSYPKIAQKIGVSRSCVDHVVNGRSFAHIPYDPQLDDANYIPF